MIQFKLCKELLNVSRTKWSTISAEIGKKEINSIISQNNTVGRAMSNVTGRISEPSLLFTAEKAENGIANMVVRDGNEVVSQTTFRIPNGESLASMLPKTPKGRIVKSVIDSNDAKRLIAGNKDLKSLFEQAGLKIEEVKTPVIETATKSNGKFDIVHVTVKDGDTVVLKGAYSTSPGAKEGIESVEKYHFTTAKNRATGYSENKSSFNYSNREERNINFELRDFFEKGGRLDMKTRFKDSLIFGDYRPYEFGCLYSDDPIYVLEQLSKGKSYNEIAEKINRFLDHSIHVNGDRFTRRIPDSSFVGKIESKGLADIDSAKMHYGSTTLDELSDSVKKDIQKEMKKEMKRDLKYRYNI